MPTATCLVGFCFLLQLVLCRERELYSVFLRWVFVDSCCEFVQVGAALPLLEVAMRPEERNGAMGRVRDQFPAGMRVLAVDDDPVCLKVLETLLRRCQYHGKDLCSSWLFMVRCC